VGRPADERDLAFFTGLTNRRGRPPEAETGV